MYDWYDNAALAACPCSSVSQLVSSIAAPEHHHNDLIIGTQHDRSQRITRQPGLRFKTTKWTLVARSGSSAVWTVVVRVINRQPRVSTPTSRCSCVMNWWTSCTSWTITFSFARKRNSNRYQGCILHWYTREVKCGIVWVHVDSRMVLYVCARGMVL
jgi:hypothetical protein